MHNYFNFSFEGKISQWQIFGFHLDPTYACVRGHCASGHDLHENRATSILVFRIVLKRSEKSEKKTFWGQEKISLFSGPNYWIKIKIWANVRLKKTARLDTMSMIFPSSSNSSGCLIRSTASFTSAPVKIHMKTTLKIATMISIRENPKLYRRDGGFELKDRAIRLRRKLERSVNMWQASDKIAEKSKESSGKVSVWLTRSCPTRKRWDLKVFYT